MDARAKAAALLLTIAMAAFFPAPVAAAPSAGLEGRWRLAEQRPGAGRADLLRESPPLWLQFVREGPRLVGRMRLEGASPSVYEWPALGSAHGARRLSIIRLSIDEAAGRAQARYTTPASGDDATLDVTEEYALSTDGRTLEGTVTITLVEQGESRGIYAVHRLFERVP